MAPRTYYNEIDPYAAQWIRNLISAGHVSPGDVDQRDIRDVRPGDLKGYTRCHFFAGIAVWDYALGLAGWPEDRPVWTGSCPCQPFSAAGRGGRVSDERHLWPAFFHLIEMVKPQVVFGEQVASKDGLAWLDLVQADLEGADYDVAAADLCAAGIGAPHIRQRLWFVADAGRERCHRESARVWRPGEARRDKADRFEVDWCSQTGGALAHADEQRHDRCRTRSAGRNEPADSGIAGFLGDATSRQFGRRAPETLLRRQGPAGGSSPWSDPDWLPFRDGKARPVEPGTFPLAHGASARVGRLRAYGNAISPYPAAEVIGAYLDTACA